MQCFALFFNYSEFVVGPVILSSSGIISATVILGNDPQTVSVYSACKHIVQLIVSK